MYVRARQICCRARWPMAARSTCWPPTPVGAWLCPVVAASSEIMEGTCPTHLLQAEVAAPTSAPIRASTRTTASATTEGQAQLTQIASSVQIARIVARDKLPIVCYAPTRAFTRWMASVTTAGRAPNTTRVHSARIARIAPCAPAHRRRRAPQLLCTTSCTTWTVMVREGQRLPQLGISAAAPLTSRRRVISMATVPAAAISHIPRPATLRHRQARGPGLWTAGLAGQPPWTLLWRSLRRRHQRHHSRPHSPHHCPRSRS